MDEMKRQTKLQALLPHEISSYVLNLDQESLVALFNESNLANVQSIFAHANNLACERIFSKLPPAQLSELLGKVRISSAIKFLSSTSNKSLFSLVEFIDVQFVKKLIDEGFSPTRSMALIRRMTQESQDVLRDYWKENKEKNKPKSSQNTRSYPRVNLQRLLRQAVLDVEHNEPKVDLDNLLRATPNEKSMLSRKVEEMRKGIAQLQLEKKNLLDEKTQYAQHIEELLTKLLEYEAKDKENLQQKIDVKVAGYVTESVNKLTTNEEFYRKKAWYWSIYGNAVLAVAIVAIICIGLYGAGAFSKGGTELSWPLLMFVSFKGLIILGVLSLWAKHAFTVSNAYSHEAIKRSDRAHAINFGKLYLEIYGNTVERTEIINIFENWNIATESAFSKVAPSDFDPKVIEKFIEIAKLLKPDKAKKS